MSKFKTFISNYSISIAACALTLMLVGVWHIFANPTKTIIGDDVDVAGNVRVRGDLEIDNKIVGLTKSIYEDTVTVPADSHRSVSLTCPEGKFMVSGGVRSDNLSRFTRGYQSWPSGDNEWTCAVYRSHTNEMTLHCYIVCLNNVN
jgi:hypothetical protein